MKIFHTLLLFLCTLCVYSQASQVSAIPHQNPVDGTYLFQKATIAVYNANSMAMVDSRTVNDLTAFSDGESLFFQNLFQEAVIYNGVLRFCILADKHAYVVRNETALFSIGKYSKTGGSDILESERLIPYKLSIESSTITFTTSCLYGNSKYTFPLEGKLTLTMIKQK